MFFCDLDSFYHSFNRTGTALIFNCHFYKLECSLSESGLCLFGILFMFLIGIVTFLFTVRYVVAARLCFHKRLWFCSQGGVADTPRADTPPCGRTYPGQTPPTQCMLGYTPSHPVHSGVHPPQPLQRTVRIVMECILVFNFDFTILYCRWNIFQDVCCILCTGTSLFQGR